MDFLQIANARQSCRAYDEGREVEQEKKVWQRSFHDHVIRNQKRYERIWQYIDNNPQKWEEDCFYPTEQKA